MNQIKHQPQYPPMSDKDIEGDPPITNTNDARHKYLSIELQTPLDQDNTSEARQNQPIFEHQQVKEHPDTSDSRQNNPIVEAPTPIGQNQTSDARQTYREPEPRQAVTSHARQIYLSIDTQQPVSQGTTSDAHQDYPTRPTTPVPPTEEELLDDAASIATVNTEMEYALLRSTQSTPVSGFQALSLDFPPLTGGLSPVQEGPDLPTTSHSYSSKVTSMRQLSTATKKEEKLMPAAKKTLFESTGSSTPALLKRLAASQQLFARLLMIPLS